MQTLYKWLPSESLAKIVAGGVFRFYELQKYIGMEDQQSQGGEDDSGRADIMEGSIGFEKEEVKAFPEKLMAVIFTPQSGDSVVMRCSSIKRDRSFFSQYFVFCVTKSSKRAIKDCTYAVVLGDDIFDLFEKLFDELLEDGRKMFSHGEVLYYDIHNHPSNISNEMWKEVFYKHSKFSPQEEYRAAMFIPADHFDRIVIEGEKKILEISKDGKKIDYEVEIKLRAGLDSEGWKYIEIDASDIHRKFNFLSLNLSPLVAINSL
jgi:hypothetical protein